MKIDPKQVITLDFETYWAYDFSLKSKTLNTSEYIRSPRFLAHCCSIKVGNKKTKVFPGSKLKEEFAKIDWANTDIVAHNMAFDGAILAWHYGIKPRRYFDTLSMTRGLHGDMTRASLDTIARYYGIGAKSTTYLAPTKGLRELSPEIYKNLAAGCAIDTDLCYEIFCKQIEVYPEDELALIDLTMRMFIDPTMHVDIPRAEQALQYEQQARLRAMALSLVDEKTLNSSPKFAQALRDVGCEPPMKWSAKQNCMAYAFAQSDPDFIELQDHENIRVVRLVQGRLAAKSTIVETRAYRLIQAGQHGQALPVMLNYFGAKTGRWSGGNKLNLQNLNRQEYDETGKPVPMTGELRKSIIAPKGHVILVCDSAQIEARTLAWLAGQEDLVEAFRNGEDVYKKAACNIYGVPIEEINKEQRFVGKVCLAEGTLILSNRGWIRIETLQLSDKLWDGENWVCHSGLVMNGFRETLNLCGLWLTPDHLVWSGTQWQEARYLEHDVVSLSQALDFAAARLPLRATSKALAAACRPSLFAVAAETLNTRSTSRISNTSRVRAVTNALKKRLYESAIGSMQKLCLMTNIVRGFLTASHLPSAAATTSAAPSTFTTAPAEFTCIKSGATTVPRSSSMHKLFLDGMRQSWRWIESILTTGIARVISALQHDRSIWATAERSQTSRKNCAVYDVLSVGPKNRFLALTNKGPLLVHNCVLGLGYGMGAAKFQTTLALGMMGPPVTLPAELCKKTVNTYRRVNHMIPALWKEAERVLAKMAAHKEGDWGVLSHDETSVWLPSGMGLHYPQLKVLWDPEKDRVSGYEYMANGNPKKIYGGLLVENICQALARIIVSHQMLLTQDYFKTLKLKKGEVARIASMSHDEIISVVPARLADKAKQKQIDIMRTAPDWAEGLPLNAEAGYAVNYSK